jgi:hypothetical protein
VESSRHKHAKLLAAAALAGAIAAIGVMAAVAVGQQQAGTPMGSQMSVGETATTTTPPLTAPTPKAVPVMTATRPKGF